MRFCGDLNKFIVEPFDEESRALFMAGSSMSPEESWVDAGDMAGFFTGDLVAGFTPISPISLVMIGLYATGDG